MYRRRLKRIADCVLATLLLVFLSPLMLLTALFVRLWLGSPVLFVQQRPGWHEKTFYLYKFRTMRDIKDAHGIPLNDGERLTRFGRLLRSASLDELPALLNVVKGDMSLIGPRPLLMEYLPWYSSEQKKRHLVRPGITGWAQVNGRNALSWQKKFELDIWYVQHCSFWLDCRIFWLTLLRVLQRRDIHAEGQATMTRFDLECMEAGQTQSKE